MKNAFNFYQTLDQSFNIEPFTFTPTTLAGSFVIEPTVREDSRGWFYRMYDKTVFEKASLTTDWLQMNHSFTQQKGTVRGMHFQFPPYSEVKMLRCVSGSVYDVIIDLRKGSPTFLQWFGVELSANNKKILYIPQGFAHGFQALEDNAGLIYQHSQLYQPGFEGGIRFDDPKVNIQWPLHIELISDRDAAHPFIVEDFEGINV